MMRNRYTLRLGQLNSRMLTLGAMCENAIAAAAKALLECSGDKAKQLPELADEIEKQEREIVALCMELLLREQPVASDLRAVSSALKMVTDMKRIGDQSADIAEIAGMANIAAGEDMPDIRDMALATIKMVSDSMEAYINRDIAAARAVIAYDDVVDDCFDRVKRRLIELFGLPDTNGEYAIDLLMVAKYFERIGDHAANIAQWVIFAISGKRD